MNADRCLSGFVGALTFITQVMKLLPGRRGAMLVGWRLERSEIALTLLTKNTCYVAFWEKAYFARMNRQ